MAQQIVQDGNMSSDEEKEGGFIMLTDDNEVEKKILISGDINSITPPRNSEVRFHFIGKILSTGKIFDSSRKKREGKNGKMYKPQAASFLLNSNSNNNILALDIALPTMKKNEISIIRCSSSYGYGINGLKNNKINIPPNASLEFEIELCGWNEWQYINNNNELKKKVIKNGFQIQNQLIIPKKDDIITLSYKGYTNNNYIFKQENNIHIICDDDIRVTEAFHIGLQSMEYGEHSIIQCSDYNLGYGLEGNCDLNIPYFAEINYEIHIHHIQIAKNRDEYNDREKLAKSKKYKVEGNELFSKNMFSGAIKKYNKSLEWASIVKCSDDNNNDIFGDKQLIFVDINNNISLIYLKEKDWDNVILYGNRALSYDCNNVKALSRLGHAKIMQQKWIDAKIDLKKARSIDKNNKYVNKLYNKVQNKMKQQKDKQKKQWGSMFGYRPDKNKNKNKNKDKKKIKNNKKKLKKNNINDAIDNDNTTQTVIKTKSAVNDNS